MKKIEAKNSLQNTPKNDRVKVVTRDGKNITVEGRERIENLKSLLLQTNKNYVEIDGETINLIDISGIYKDAPNSCLTIIGEDNTELLKNKEMLGKMKWVISTRSNLDHTISSEDYAKLIEVLKEKKSGKILVGLETIDIMEITTITTEEEHNKAKKLKQGYWECSYGTLHDRGEKCNKEECYLKNNVEYNQLINRYGELMEELKECDKYDFLKIDKIKRIIDNFGKRIETIREYAYKLSRK